MKTTGITENSCDRIGCTNQEKINPGKKCKAKWEEVTFRKTKFDFCQSCVSQIFGKEYADQFEIAKNARHLKKPAIEDAAKDEGMFSLMEHLDGRMEEVAPKKFLERPMELNVGGE